jgi:hypothetical protein
MLPLFLLFLACKPAAVEPTSPALRWIKAFEGDSWANTKTGLNWSLSLLGIVPDQEVVVLEQSSDQVIFKLPESYLLQDGEYSAFGVLVMGLSETEEYQAFESYDLGRLLMQSLYNPGLYYAQTSACPTLSDWKALHLQGELAQYAITTSLLLPGERRVELTVNTASLQSVALLIEEGEGSLEDGSFIAEESEVIDLLPSAQQRFAIYSKEGLLEPVATVSPAGQPGRCMWCHEGYLQRGSEENQSIPDYLSKEDFLSEVDIIHSILDQYRQQLNSRLDYSDIWAHSYGEWIVELFLQPSASRVSNEWGISEEEVIEILGEPEYLNSEWPEFAPGYVRAQVDAAQRLRGVSSAPVLSSFREAIPTDPLLQIPEDLGCSRTTLLWE